MPDPTLAERLSAFAVETRSKGVPAAVGASVARRVLDILGIQVAATRLDTSGAALTVAASEGGRSGVDVIALSHPSPPTWAAFAGGVLAHSLDYDDTHLPSVLHPSASVVPAAMASAQAAGADGEALTRAVAVGIEVCVRLGMAGFDPEARNSTFFEHGQHATSICGTIGAAVSASMLFGLPESRIVDSIGIAASMASGILEGNRSGGTVKRMHCGWAAHAGVTASRLAAAGITGPPSSLEGRFGFFEAFLHGTYDPGQVTAALGDRWEVPGIFFKPYPANHFTHAAADAAMEIVRRGVDPEDIENITVGVAAPTVRTIGEPIDRKRRPATGYEAQFSGPYVVAAAILGGSGLGLGLADFRDELVADPRRRALMDRIDVVADSECGEIYPYQFPARIDVTVRDGSRETVAVLENRGGPDRPLEDAELETKFKDNVMGILDASSADFVIDACRDLRAVPDVSSIIRTINDGMSST